MRIVTTTALLLLIIGPSVVFSQDVETLRSEFQAAMRKSVELTKDISYRTKITVEMGTTSTTTDWQPYSSRVVESSFPDRAHVTFTSSIKSEFIQIGKVRYETSPNGTWVRTEVSKDPPIRNPAAAIGVSGPSFEFSKTSSQADDGDATIFCIIKNPEPGAKDFAQVVTFTFWFDGKGILYKFDSIAYNGKAWVRTTSNYEYDPSIKIEAPIN